MTFSGQENSVGVRVWDEFCPLMISFANSLDPDQAQ